MWGLLVIRERSLFVAGQFLLDVMVAWARNTSKPLDSGTTQADSQDRDVWGCRGPRV
jgi:hypothetical protein